MTTTSTPSEGRGAVNNPSNSTSDDHTTNATPPLEQLFAPPPPVVVSSRPPVSRDASVTRGRASSASGPRNPPSRSITPVMQIRPQKSGDIERKPSQSYGHHRQTSIVHGVQHGRNPSLLSTTTSATSSPISPQTMLSSPSSEVSLPTLKKSPSLSTLHSNGGGGSSSSGSAFTVNRAALDNGKPQRPSDRMHSGGIKRNHSHARSQSRAQAPPPPPPQELKTVGEYALHHLFTSFIAAADERIDRCIVKEGEREPRVEQICGPGADPAFDQLISSLGHINRHKPKSLIDSVISWRKRKADHANVILEEQADGRPSNGLLGPRARTGSASAPASPPDGQTALFMNDKVVIAERRSGISIYILCRVLIEVLKQTTLESLNGPDNKWDTANRLEEVIYGQLQSVDDTIKTSTLRHSNWMIRGELLGVMSGIRFQEVADRFLKDLALAQKKLSVKGQADEWFVEKTAMLVQSMRWLKIQSSPAESWEKSCDMLLVVAKFFVGVHGRPMKHAYSVLFESLLLPVAATASNELGTAKWKEVLAIIHPKISQMLNKAEHWPYVFPLEAVLLCVSPAEQLTSQWLPLILSSQPKVKDRAARSHSLKATCRLVWRVLYRGSESQNAVVKKLEEVVKAVFQGGKRVLVATDPIIADPLIQLIRIIGYRYQELCFRSIIFPLMSADLFSTPEKAQEVKFESLDPERTVIAIRAFLAIMSDLEKGEPPPFPVSFECDQLMDPVSRSPITHRRTKSQGFMLSAGRTERLSRPVATSQLSEVARDSYAKFCKLLQHITRICDEGIGGKAVLSEKFSSQTPKTPMAEAFMFNRKDDVANPTDLRQNYYDLLHVAVEALPRCLSPSLPIPNSQVNLLCTGTAHVQSHIARSSVQALKSIARQAHAQQITIGFARFIFNFDGQYATVSDNSLLGPGHIETTLRLYVELLEIWIDEIQQRTRKAVVEPTAEDPEPLVVELPLDLSGVLAHVDEVESHGLFFLCSPSRAVRAIAVTVLHLVTKFDTALGKPATRIISILEGGADKVISINDDRLSTAERSRLQKGLLRKGNSDSTLVELCSSDIAHDANLWFKLFPNLVRLSQDVCLQAVALTRELVCQRLGHSQLWIEQLADLSRQNAAGAASEQGLAQYGRPGGRYYPSSSDTIIEQWKIHLIFACTTLTNIGGSSVKEQTPKANQTALHTRKSSKSSGNKSEKVSSATELFKSVVKFLDCPNAAIRKAAVVGLGATNATLFQTLVESLYEPVLRTTHEQRLHLDPKMRGVNGFRRTRQVEYLRTEIAHLYSLTAHLLDTDVPQSGVLTYMVDYAKQLRLFLSDAEIQHELEHQKLRTYFCTFIESLYETSRKQKEEGRSLSFQYRLATFTLMENWCGLSPIETQLRERERTWRRSVLDREQDARHHGIIDATFEKEKLELQNAALSAMAALCAGPLNFVADNKVLMQFDIRRLLTWIHAIFQTPSDRPHAVGRKALQNLITHNVDVPFLMQQAMRMCYIARSPKALASYFEVVTRVLTENPNVTTPFWKILCACLYTLGNEDRHIRMKSTHLLRSLEERQGKTSKLQDLDISVSDKTTAVYKLAQFEISRRLAKQHPELAFHVFSEFSAYFNELEPDHQRNMVSGMLPWIQTTQLMLDPNGGPVPTSYMLLVNLFEITVRSSITLHNEIQALWQALATGPYGGNVQLVLDFIITICLERREQNFVLYAKQIVVFLSKTPAGARVVEYLLLQITPRNMVPETRETSVAPPDTAGLPYVAKLESMLPRGGRQGGIALGQLSMILLVDLVVSPFNLPADKLPTLLQVILAQWDVYASIVQDQARELLVHLIHELVISKIEPGSTEPDKKAIEDFIELVRGSDPKILWVYTDGELRPSDEHNRTVPEPMAYVVDEVVKIFSVTYPGLREAWGKVTMTWATSCAVRHVACRSFQVFRCVSTTLDQQMLADMLARLSNTIADDENHDYLLFSLEILTTLRRVIDTLTPLDLLDYPQLFWTTVACLDTIFEREFEEGLNMLGLLLNKMDLSDPAVLKLLRESQPTKWEGGFSGLHSLVYKGMRSSRSMDRSLAIMERLLKLPSSDIVSSDDRLLFTILANLPRFLDQFRLDATASAQCLQSAETLASAAESQKYAGLARALQTLATGAFRDEADFLAQCVSAIKAAFFPAQEFHTLVFLLGMVNNQCSWFKVKTMQVLCVLIPEVDMRNPQIASQGPDLISPLLRLLQTPHYQQALDVLDNVIDMSSTPLDSKHLRMSMAGSHSTRATRKEYDSTMSLYGIPEESGWSVPVPAVHSKQTRGNVNAVFNTLARPDWSGVGGGSDEPAGTPEIEFHADEYTYFASDRTGTMMSDDTKADGTMGDLAVQLDSLDDFFDEENDASSPLDFSSPSAAAAVAAAAANGSGLAIETRESLYDQQALPILHRSLQRNASISSFQNGFAESRYPAPPREPAVMNPGAFAAAVPPSTPGGTGVSATPGAAAPSGRTPPRPGLHSRSITSPAAPTKKSAPSHHNHPPPPHPLHHHHLAQQQQQAHLDYSSSQSHRSSFSADDQYPTPADNHYDPTSLSDDEVQMSRVRTADDLPNQSSYLSPSTHNGSGNVGAASNGYHRVDSYAAGLSDSPFSAAYGYGYGNGNSSYSYHSSQNSGNSNSSIHNSHTTSSNANSFLSNTSMTSGSIQNTVKPASGGASTAGFANTVRQGLRRLTSSGGNSNREALRLAAGSAGAGGAGIGGQRDKSPRVPRVPATFLKGDGE